MAEVTGNIAAAMANAPILTQEHKATKGDRKNPILAKLGVPSFMTGDGKTYPRTTGFGNSRKPHPDGGTNETVAWVVFTPYEGLTVTHEGRIYCEKFAENGKQKRVFSISLPFLKAERRDNAGRQAIENVKVTVRDLYRAWLASNDGKVLASKSAASSIDKWEETDD